MPLNMHEITWEDFQSFSKGDGILILPVGSTEQHGPHLPLGVDTIIPCEIAKRLAERTDVMVAPAIAWGYKPQPGSSGGTDFPGTCSLDATTLITLVRDLLRELLRHGIRRMILLDGHYENALFLSEAVSLALRDSGAPPNTKIVIVRWFDLVKAEEFDRIFPDFEGVALEHAANLETAMMLYLRPELVKREKIHGDRAERYPPYLVLPPTEDLIPRTGVLTGIKRVDSLQGEELTNIVVDRLLELIGTEFSKNRRS
jgi:creatinine amidohydrolase